MKDTQFPRLCFVGPMVGRNPGQVTTQGLILAERFSTVHESVLTTSALTNRYLRLLDIIRTLVLRRRWIDVQCLEIYSGASFVVQDVSSFLGNFFGHGLVMVLHGGALPEFMARYPRWSRRVLSRADALIAPSHYLARAVEQYGFKAAVIPNVIDLSAYPFRRRRVLKPRLFWMRTFHPIWNPAMAIRVLARLRQDVPDASLVMAGRELGLERDMRQLANDLGVAGSVRFAGFLDMAAKAREGDHADIFISTNHVDNMPVAVVEACAMGLPVVTTRVGGISDLLTDGENGLLVPDDDVEAMTGAIRRLLADPDLAERLSGNGRHLAELSSWEQVRPKWESVFASSRERRKERRIQ